MIKVNGPKIDGHIKAKAWTGTLFFDESKIEEMLEDILYIAELGNSNSSILRWVGQIEMCPSTYRLHLQVYVEFRAEWTRTKAAHIFGKGHWEVVKDLDKCIGYCMKEETRIACPFGSNNIQHLSAVRAEQKLVHGYSLLDYPLLTAEKISLLNRIREICN